jgi:hypothetical protein
MLLTAPSNFSVSHNPVVQGETTQFHGITVPGGRICIGTLIGSFGFDKWYESDTADSAGNFTVNTPPITRNPGTYHLVAVPLVAVTSCDYTQPSNDIGLVVLAPAQPSSWTFRVKGNGHMYILKNGELVGHVTSPTDQKIITFNTGDQCTMNCVPYNQSAFNKLCDVPETECVTTNPTTRTITATSGSFIMEGTFSNMWKCSGAPGYTCSEVSSGGTHSTKAGCEAACHAGPISGLSVDGKQGSVTAKLNTPIVVSLSGIGVNKAFMIYDGNLLTGSLFAQGTTDGSGNYSTTVQYAVNSAFDLRAYYNCIGNICVDETNHVKLTVGDAPFDYIMWAVVAVILVILFFYSKELGVFKAITKG